MNHFQYKDGVLCAEGVRLDALAQKVGTPFYCYSTATLEHHYKVFANAVPKGSLVAYAMKANDNMAVLKTLARLGAGADVVSGGELAKALAAGIAANRIVFSGVGKTADEMRAGLEAGIHQFNVESEPELAALDAVAHGMGKRAPVTLRINPDVDARTHAKINTGTAETKFGIPFSRARAAYAQAAKLPGIEIVGIDVHIGSQITDLEPFETAFTRIGELIQTLRLDGHVISRLDLGGGLGVPYEQTNTPPPDPVAYGAMVTRGDEGFRLYPVVRAGTPDRRQCRRAGVARDLCEARRRQDLFDHRCRDERSDPPRDVRSPSRDRGDRGTRARFRAPGIRCGRTGVRDRRSFRFGPGAAGPQKRRSCGNPVGGRLWRGDGGRLQCAAARGRSLGIGRAMGHRAPQGKLMPISLPRTASPTGWPDSLSRRVALARVVLVIEKLLPRLWPAAGFAGFYLALALTGIFALVPWLAQALLLAATLTAIGLSLADGFEDFVWPRGIDAERRLERDSGLAHRPVSEREMTCWWGHDPFAQALWTLHRARGLPAKFRLGLPRADIAAPRSARLALDGAGGAGGGHRAGARRYRGAAGVGL